MSHNRLYELSNEPFKSKAEYLSETFLDLNDFPASWCIDYFGGSDSNRDEDIELLKSNLPFAKITRENGEYLLHVDKKFREELTKQLNENMIKASEFIKEELEDNPTHLNSIRVQANNMMHMTELLFHIDYIQTDLNLTEWLTCNEDIEKLYIGAIIDFHY